MYLNCAATRRCPEQATGMAQLPEPDQIPKNGVPVCANHAAEVRRNGYSISPLDQDD